MTPLIAVIVKGYPRLSETFIANELAALEDRGLALAIVALRRPTDAETHPVHRRIRAPVTYLPEYLHAEPGRTLRSLRACLRLPGFAAAFGAFSRDLARDPSRNRLRRFGQACVLAAEMPAAIRHLHAHFLHTPASVARYAAMLRGLTFSAAAHARDIWTSQPWDLAGKLAAARFVTVCSAAGREALQAQAPGAPLDLVYHGIDLAAWTPPPARAPRDGRGEPVHIVSVGRLVPKKGTADVLRALSLLPPDCAWRFTHVGGGPEKEPLRAYAEMLGIAGRVTWEGAKPQERVRTLLAEADLFALAPHADADGDRDGLPNVLMEAQAMELATVATRFSAIPELIEEGETGLLVPPACPPALADAMLRLVRDPALRARLGAAARHRLARDFACAPGFDRVAALLAACLVAPAPPPEPLPNAHRLREPHEAA